MTGYYVAVAVLALLNLVSIGLSLAVGMRMQRLEKALQDRTVPAFPSGPAAVFSLVPPSPQPSAPESEPDKFSAALMGGEMNLRLAQETREPPEKYRYVTGLAEQGMSAEEIARVLHLAPGEVQQLLTLARLGRGGEG